MLKHKLAFASLLVLASCGPSREALMALDHMKIAQDNAQAGLSFRSLSGSGNDVTLSGVELRVSPSTAGLLDAPVPPSEGTAFPPAPTRPNDGGLEVVARADAMVLKGLTMKDGKPTVRDMRLSNITPVGLPAGATLSLATLGLEGMNEATGTFLAGAFAMDPALAPPAPEAVAFSKAELAGFRLAGDIPQDAAGAGSFSVELGEFALADVSGWKMGQARLAGLKGAMNVPGAPAIEGAFDFGTMTLSGIDGEFIGKSVMAGFESAMDGGAPLDYAAIYSDLTSPIDGGVDRIDWTGMTANVSGLKLDTTEMHAKLTRNADGVVTAYEFPRFSMKMAADPASGSLGAMGMMMLAMAGYQSSTIDLYMAANATFDPAKDLTRWENYNVGVTDLFDVKVSGGLIGLKQALPNLMSGIMAAAEAAEDAVDADEEAFPEDAVPDDEDDSADDGDVPPEPEDEADAGGGDIFGGASPEMLMSLVMGVLPLQVTDLDLAITDTKLVDLLLNSQAIEAGQTLEAYRADLVTMVAASSVFLTDAGVDGAIASELTAAASGFMAGPGTLRIQLRPKTPLGVMSAMAAPLTKESLGFSATFTPAAPAVN